MSAIESKPPLSQNNMLELLAEAAEIHAQETCQQQATRRKAAHKTILLSNERIYRGEVKPLGYHSEGKITCPDGSTIKGSFLSGQLDGRAVIKLSKGTEVRGNYILGKLNGWAKMTLASGIIYETNFTQDTPFGEGTLTHPDGTIYKGFFKGDYFYEFVEK